MSAPDFAADLATLADALTPDALDAWLADRPHDAPDLDAYTRRSGALTRPVAAATFTAAATGPDALDALAAALPALPRDRDAAFDVLAALTAPDAMRPTLAGLMEPE